MCPIIFNTAIDFAGPMFLMDREGFSGGLYCVLVVPLTLYNHLELVRGMTTTTFECFTARRGLPRRIISDNAKTFKATAKFIKAILGQKEVKDYLSLVSQSGVVIQSEESPLVGWDLQKNGEVNKEASEEDSGTSKLLLQRDAYCCCCDQSHYQLASPDIPVCQVIFRTRSLVLYAV